MRKRLLFSALLFFTLTLQAALAFSQQLIILDETGKQTSLARADIGALPHVKISTSVSGTAATFEGVTVKAVLARAGVGFGETMRGKRLASCLLVEASDGYRAVIALLELDPAFTDKQVLLAFLKDGKPLDDKEGPTAS